MFFFCPALLIVTTVSPAADVPTVCKTAADCYLNGDCVSGACRTSFTTRSFLPSTFFDQQLTLFYSPIPSTAGVCKCDAAWSTSPDCSTMSFLEQDKNHRPGYYNKYVFCLFVWRGHTRSFRRCRGQWNGTLSISRPSFPPCIHLAFN